MNDIKVPRYHFEQCILAIGHRGPCEWNNFDVPDDLVHRCQRLLGEIDGEWHRVSFEKGAE